MKLSEQEIAVRHEIVEETNIILASMDRILGSIRKTESEKQSLKALRKLRQTLEVHERQNFYLGKLN